MAYFPNGSSGDDYLSRYCVRCVNWREDTEHSGNWGCIVWDLHLFGDYNQCAKTAIGKLWESVLEHFIPTVDGEPAECRMFLENLNADVPGQMKMF